MLIVAKLVGETKGTKNQTKIDGHNHHTKDRREGQRKANKCTAHRNQRNEKVRPFHGRKLFYPQPF
jgi:hypothetical protein